MRDEAQSRIQLENARRQSVLRSEAEKLVRNIPGQSVESIVEAMDDIGFSSSRAFEPAIETGTEAVERLEKVARAAEDLKRAMEGLNAGALTVLYRSNAPDSLKSDADSHGLPLAGNAPADSSLEDLKIWRRGGRWLVRLESLAALARHEAENVQALIQSGGSKIFPLALADSEQKQMIEFCIRRLRAWGADTKYAPRMARAIKRAHKAKNDEKVGPRWGDAMYRKLLRSSPG